ncbi:opioid growth factor receptor-related protein [Alphaproteobacteria bacterium]|nr:opioid growth factor receptor-related protein [Alphaproteobacteria bacterium]
MTSLCSFLTGHETNSSGWLLSHVWKFNDTQIENTHTFIQWVFPTDEPSRATPGSPVLDDEQILAIQNSEQAKQNLSKSAEWYFDFLRRNNFWRKPHDHNHLRITRVIKSLRLLCGDDEADYFKEQFWQLLGTDISQIPSRTIEYWEDA